MARRIKKRIQSRIQGGREQLPSCVIPKLLHIVESEAAKYNVSKSWIVAVAVARFFGLKEDEVIDYD